MKDKTMLGYIIALVAVIIIFILLSVAVNRHNNLEDGIKFKEEYEALNSGISMNIEKTNPIKYLDFDGVKELFEKGTGVIYFGFPSCPWCRNMIPVLFDVAETNNHDTIYYLNPRELKTNYNDQYLELLKILNPYLKEKDGKKVFSVPDVYFIKNGQVVGHHISTVDSQTNPGVALNTEQTKELFGIYQELFNKLK